MTPPYRLSPEKKAILKAEVQELLRKGVIEESDSPWAFNAVLVKKKDGSNRMCIDFRALNKVTERDHYPMPRIDDLLHASGKAAVFSSIDLRWVYWLIPLRAEDRPKAVFITPFGLYQWRVMAFGLINAGAMSQRLAG